MFCGFCHARESYTLVSCSVAGLSSDHTILKYALFLFMCVCHDVFIFHFLRRTSISDPFVCTRPDRRGVRCRTDIRELKETRWGPARRHGHAMIYLPKEKKWIICCPWSALQGP